jgi:hypothetical protein
MKYFIIYYLKNPNYHSIDKQKCDPIIIDDNDWIEFDKFENIKIEEKNIYLPYYIIFKYDSEEDKNLVFKYYDKEKIMNNDDLPYYYMKKKDLKNIISVIY